MSFLDLGREYWKQGQYESAASSLESAQDLLLREGLFLSIRSEIQADLFRLRPYRILELLASPDHHTNEHRKGMSLLQEMLEARRGIDGSGNDYSSLGIDDFLRFIQQLRSYMTAIEQQTLFEEEARR
ncbi:MAG TPA: molecular chaperone DnaJ, partial [Pseudanabaena sp.]|nr:molecular chaperone DnaJ [Pseudanabaena sp.]